jgi:hypothetical protein|tara:strand:+ start:764 stop:1132 length:369 start_codon:yes stop_codon:yes gene_type:complete
MNKVNNGELFKFNRAIRVGELLFEALELIDSPVQGCEFLLVHGIDNEGIPIEDAISTNLHSTKQTPGYVFVRDDDYTAELVAELIDRKFLERAGYEENSGFCSIPLMKVLFVRNPLTESTFT